MSGEPTAAVAAVVAVDANGADLGPAEVAAGAALAAQRGARVLLFGPAAEIGQVPDGVELVDAPVSIAKSPDPAKAARSTPEASIVQASRAVAAGRAHALVCAGGTGAALAAGLFNIKRAKGIHRPALALPLPAPDGPVILLDVGASAEARREHLVQFAFMGAALAETVMGVRRPKVALLSNGEEPERGTETVIEANAELAERCGRASRGGDAALGGDAAFGGDAASGEDDLRSGGVPFSFVGNIEGGDLLSGRADVVVTDGFTGNVALKLTEGVSQTVLGYVKALAMSSWRAKLGGALLLPSLRGFREQIDPERQGGAYLLGLRSLGVVPHGRFGRQGFAEAILRGKRGAEEGIAARTHDALSAAGALRRVASADVPATGAPGGKSSEVPPVSGDDASLRSQ